MSVTPVQSASVSGEIATGTDEASHRPRVIILGAGFGGLNAAMALRRAPVEVTVVDRRNYHLFQPLLYQVATAGLSPAQIAMPIRRILSRQSNATVLMDEVEAVDTAARCV
jgi:NADH dehydrogenase